MLYIHIIIEKLSQVLGMQKRSRHVFSPSVSIIATTSTIILQFSTSDLNFMYPNLFLFKGFYGVLIAFQACQEIMNFNYRINYTHQIFYTFLFALFIGHQSSIIDEWAQASVHLTLVYDIIFLVLDRKSRFELFKTSVFKWAI